MKIKRLSDILKEELQSNYKEGVNIAINIIEDDERSPRTKKTPEYIVNYQKEINNELFEIEGVLKPRYNGRRTEYHFEPDYYTNKKSEEYYDENSEEIEVDIITKFNGGI